VRLSPTAELIPIDHGMCLPGSFSDISFEWRYWPQSRLPFSEATAEYIAALDAERDLALLAAHGLAIRPACARVLRVCTLLLQKGAAPPQAALPRSLHRFLDAPHCKVLPDMPPAVPARSPFGSLAHRAASCATHRPQPRPHALSGRAAPAQARAAG